MFTDMKLKKKILAYFLFLGITPFAVIGIVSIIIATNSITKHATNKLSGIREQQKNHLEWFFNEHTNNVLAQSINPFIHEAFQRLETGFGTHENAPANDFVGRGHGSFQAPSQYREIHSYYYPMLKRMKEYHGYYDILLVSAQNSTVIFSVLKASDFGRRVDESDTSLRDVYRIAVNNGKAAISDIRPYAPSNHIPAQFVAAPLRHNGHIIGVLAFQLSFDGINSFMSKHTGLGNSGKSYLVGPDKLMRSDSRIDPKKHSILASFAGNAENNGVDTLAVQKALEGQSNTEIMHDYLDTEVISSYCPLKVGDVTWALVTEINTAEAFAGIKNLRIIMGLLSIGVLGAIILCAVLMAGSINHSLEQNINDLQTASEELKTASEQQLNSSSEQTISATQISTTMKELVVASKQTVEATTSVVSIANMTSVTAQKGGASLETAIESVEHIKHKVDDVVRNMLTLGDKIKQMDIALEIINELSEQTTILSYNATIEAAGAGESGKRFSAIADQIMKLANKAINSTKEIKILIDGIQKETNKTVLLSEDGMKAVDEGRNCIKDTKTHFEDIAASAEENLSAAKEIEMSISQQTTSIEQTAHAINGIQIAANEIKAASNQTLTTAKQMLEMANKLAAL